MDRDLGQFRSHLESNAYDLCVIGGGATGAGCALDAQLRGLRTVLVEASDFASKTSSASTKMAHGGIRYLQAAVAHLDVRQYRLVSHALHERAVMLRNAPHLAGPIEFLVPCYRRTEQLYYGAGLKMYDWIAGRGSLGHSRILGVDEAVHQRPGVQRNGLVGAATYTDGQFDDARYCLALITTFAAQGGSALNYARVIGFERRGGKIIAANVEDQITKQTFTVRSRAFVNATGPYSDGIRRLASCDVEPRLRPSKGVHLLLPMPEDWGHGGLLVPKTEDARVIFALPYNGRLLVGTSDTAASPAAEMVITRQEIDYLIRQINPYLVRPLAGSDIVSGFAGLRPLVQSGGTGDTARLIRDDEVEVDRESGMISILGGKWTTYRRMAEKTIDRVQATLGARVGGCLTRTMPLSGSEGYHPAYWRDITQQFDVGEDAARHLSHKYGTAAVEVLGLADGAPDLRRPLIEGAAPIRAEVIYSTRHEMAMTLEDVLARRIGLELYDWRLAMEAAPAVAELMGPELGWTRAEATREVDAYQSKVRHLLETAGLPGRRSPGPRTRLAS
jgi:glycerol-3-phosphate dehydrogenase